MKKFLSLLIISIFCFNLVGCGCQLQEDEETQNPIKQEENNLGETEGEKPVFNMIYDSTIEVHYKTAISTSLTTYYYFNEKKLAYICYEYYFEEMENANKFYSEKKILNGNEIFVSQSDNYVYLKYKEPANKNEDYSNFLKSVKNDKTVLKYSEN